MKTPSKIITALALAGLAVAGGAAFTAPGVTQTSASQVVGGQVTQGVVGANVDSVVYGFASGDSSHTLGVQTIKVTLHDALPNAGLPTIATSPAASTYTADGSFGIATPGGTGGNEYTFTWTETAGGNGKPGMLGLISLTVTIPAELTP